ncbi:calcium/sodium antiporter [Hahella sp. CR1]|uniref:calcium/sodium antiporter n=1 Tax=Hahella sp. CR1 TaxID=2992807 RepID=UPI00244346B1|nr:calcium/sodium antiporter [Hahella sp. CR1]MDG9666798.1 calcium/sodium antiporter [Hahella sp. CR1]
MLIAAAAIFVGLIVLLWSADRFVDGAAATAKHAGMPALLIGMVVVGFGTSAPEMVVSALAALEGSPGLALGNAVGSNITNIALILGVTALLSPIAVKSGIVRRELPILIGVSAVAILLLLDKHLSRTDAFILLGIFVVVMGWSIMTGLKGDGDALVGELESEYEQDHMSLKMALFWLVIGLLLLTASSRLLVWGAVETASFFGVSDLIIGLTIVAIGTSLPELASAIAATRKGEHDIALGNVIGSNLFNTLTVIGIAGAIHPLTTESDILYRDFPVMGFLTITLFAFCYSRANQGLINRTKGGLLIACYAAYTIWLVQSALSQASLA